MRLPATPGRDISFDIPVDPTYVLLSLVLLRQARFCVHRTSSDIKRVWKSQGVQTSWQILSVRLAHIPGSLMGEIQSEVAVEATPLLSFVLRNSRIIVTCIVLLVLVIAGVGGWQWHQTRVEREAHLELGRILVSTQGPERIAALETFLPAAPSAMKSGVQLEIATTALGLEQYGKAADAYAAVAAADPKGSIGMMAAINQADLLQRQGKYAEALAVFDSLEKSAPESLRPAILEGQAMSAELAGKLDRALAAYESIATSLGDAANNGYFQAKIAELKARMAS